MSVELPKGVKYKVYKTDKYTIYYVMAAPYTTDIAENSDSTFTKLAFNSPFSTNSANFSTMVV